MYELPVVSTHYWVIFESILVRMAKSTKEVVIANVKTLMSMRQDTTYSLAKRAGLAQSTIVNILSGRHKISVDTAESLANAYGLDGWHLLLRNLDADLLGSPRIDKLYQRYIAASGEGRDYIDSVAERESKYTIKPE